ncbi:MAG: hypothetical protein ACI8XX_002316, partial [Polaribacter sp.]
QYHPYTKILAGLTILIDSNFSHGMLLSKSNMA